MIVPAEITPINYSPESSISSEMDSDHSPGEAEATTEDADSTPPAPESEHPESSPTSSDEFYSNKFLHDISATMLFLTDARNRRITNRVSEETSKRFRVNVLREVACVCGNQRSTYGKCGEGRTPVMVTPWSVASSAVYTKIDDRCRLCSEVKTDLRYIFNDYRLVENIRHHINIYILDNDDLPKNVCDSCVHSLETAAKFISECHQAQHKLYRFRRVLPDGEAPVYTCYIQTGTTIKEEYSEEITVDEDINPADVRFTRTNATSEVSLAADGEQNIFLTIKYEPEGWSKLSRLDDQRKIRLGKILYDKLKNRIEQDRHITLTVSEIDEELTELEDPLLEENTEPSSIVDTGRNDIPNGTVASSPSVLTDAAEDFGRLELHCDLCSFTTTKNWYLNQHYNDTHAKPFTCEQCGKGFGDANRLQKHVKAEHTDRSPVTCKICTMKFTQRYHYTQHMQTHRGNNATSWTCDDCGEHFSQVNKLNYHKAVRHKSDELRCPHCSFIAKSKYNLKQHDREVHHKTFECNECAKKVSKKSKLIEHIQSKHLKIPYECDACHSKYSSKKWFDGHVEKCPQRAFMRQVSPTLPMLREIISQL